MKFSVPKEHSYEPRIAYEARGNYKTSYEGRVGGYEGRGNYFKGGYEGRVGGYEGQRGGYESFNRSFDSYEPRIAYEGQGGVLRSLRNIWKKISGDRP